MRVTNRGFISYLTIGSVMDKRQSAWRTTLDRTADAVPTEAPFKSSDPTPSGFPMLSHFAAPAPPPCAPPPTQTRRSPRLQTGSELGLGHRKPLDSRSPGLFTTRSRAHSILLPFRAKSSDPAWFAQRSHCTLLRGPHPLDF